MGQPARLQVGDPDDVDTLAEVESTGIMQHRSGLQVEPECKKYAVYRVGTHDKMRKCKVERLTRYGRPAGVRVCTTRSVKCVEHSFKISGRVLKTKTLSLAYIRI